MLIRSFKD